jgi:hypothetical protein
VGDPGLSAFVVALERHWTLRRGAPHTLSPRDFALARAWFETGLPLHAVLAGIERALERDPAAASLAFCRPFVERAAARAPLARPPAAGAGDATGGASDLGPALRALVAALERRGSPAAFERPARTLREIAELLEVAPRPNWAHLRERIGEADAELSRAALEALTADERATIEAEAEAAVSRQRGHVEGGSLAQSLRRYLVRRARERAGLPPPLRLD